jgi:hypothetical protein
VPFKVVTHHNPNMTFETKQTLSPRQARWQEYLARFQYEWRYIKCRTNMADPLSRRPDAHKISLAALLTRSGRQVGGSPEATAPEPAAKPEPTRETRAGRGINRWREQLPGEEPARKRRRRAPPADANTGPTPESAPDTRAAAPQRDADTPSLHEHVKQAYEHDEWFTDPGNTADLRFDDAAGLWLRGDTVVVPNDRALGQRIMH